MKLELKGVKISPPLAVAVLLLFALSKKLKTFAYKMNFAFLILLLNSEERFSTSEANSVVKMVSFFCEALIFCTLSPNHRKRTSSSNSKAFTIIKACLQTFLLLQQAMQFSIVLSSFIKVERALCCAALPP